MDESHLLMVTVWVKHRIDNGKYINHLLGDLNAVVKIGKEKVISCELKSLICDKIRERKKLNL